MLVELAFQKVTQVDKIINFYGKYFIKCNYLMYAGAFCSNNACDGVMVICFLCLI